MKSPQQSNSDYFQSVSSSPSCFWSYVRSLCKSSDSIPALSLPNSSPVLSDSHKANPSNSTCSSFFTFDPSPPIPPSPITSEVLCSDLLCSVEEIFYIISALPLNSACSPDEVSTLLLKLMSSSISLPLKHIFNQSISSGTFPFT